MRTKVSGPERLVNELAMEMKKKERLTKCTSFTIFKNSLFMQAYLIISMDVLELDR